MVVIPPPPPPLTDPALELVERVRREVAVRLGLEAWEKRLRMVVISWRRRS